MRIESLSPTSAQNNFLPANERSVSGNLSASNGGNSSLQKLNTAQIEKNQTQPSSKNQQQHVPQFPEDEVTVQFDKPMNDDILIYQFLDKQSGSLILQVPSSQVLGVAHEIQNELQQQASEERVAEQSVEENAIKRGGTPHGD